MEKPAIKNIELLVHPFFHLRYRFPEPGTLAVLRDYYNPNSELTGQEHEQIRTSFFKKWMGVWGKIVQSVEKNPQSILVMTRMNLPDATTKVWDGKKAKITKLTRPQEEYSRFAAFAHKRLGNRFVTVSPSIDSGWKSLDLKRIVENRHFNIAQRLHINGFGEYASDCVLHSTQELENSLKAGGFRVTKAINPKASFSHSDAFQYYNNKEREILRKRQLQEARKKKPAVPKPRNRHFRP
ncbi:MAG: hypothetical protein Q7R70_04805 [Candidatus Diapherotrites archaeon]|nr:hypothetical protein [Candidatus Diapherotrites archaeon]